MAPKLSKYNKLKDYKSADQVLGSKTSKVIGNNTELRRKSNGRITVLLHDNRIITYYPDNVTELFAAGYRSNTTKDRLNRYTPSQYSINQRSGTWYLFKNGERKSKFFNGMKLKE